MKEKIKKFNSLLEKLIRIFNFIFFIVSLTLWIYLTTINLINEAFSLNIFWAAFNQMYSQISFKIGCIGLIGLNGFNAIKDFLSEYKDLQENFQQAKKIKKYLKKKKHPQKTIQIK